jgi:ribose transport system substrate-binding protein
MSEEPRDPQSGLPPELHNLFGRRVFLAGSLGAATAALLAACTSNSPDASSTTSASPATTAGGTTGATTAGPTSAGTTSAASSAISSVITSNPEGKMVKIGFSAPAADHGWIAAITNNVKQIATQLPDVEMHVVEGTNDVNQQISQVETLINDKMDAIVLLPFDGAHDRRGA